MNLLFGLFVGLVVAVLVRRFSRGGSGLDPASRSEGRAVGQVDPAAEENPNGAGSEAARKIEEDREAEREARLRAWSIEGTNGAVTARLTLDLDSGAGAYRLVMEQGSEQRELGLIVEGFWPAEIKVGPGATCVALATSDEEMRDVWVSYLAAMDVQSGKVLARREFDGYMTSFDFVGDHIEVRADGGVHRVALTES